MFKYLLIESRDPLEANQVENDYRIAADLARAENQVTLFLVQNGVAPSRKGAGNNGLERVIASGVRVLSDDFSLRERGIDERDLIDGVKAAPLDVVVGQLSDGHKAMWM